MVYHVASAMTRAQLVLNEALRNLYILPLPHVHILSLRPFLLQPHAAVLTMNSNETAYSRFEPHPEEIAFSSFSKQPQAIVTQTEQNWIPQTKTGRTPRSRAPGSLLYEWRWEISAWLLGTCAIGSIVALLIVFNNRPLREWTPRFRPAPAVAALSQVAQSALLFSVSSCIGQLKWDWLRQTRSASDFDKFEDAARGPQGSLLLLPRTRL
jgi:hypothetical protein